MSNELKQVQERLLEKYGISDVGVVIAQLEKQLEDQDHCWKRIVDNVKHDFERFRRQKFQELEMKQKQLDHILKNINIVRTPPVMMLSKDVSVNFLSDKNKKLTEALKRIGKMRGDGTSELVNDMANSAIEALEE